MGIKHVFSNAIADGTNTQIVRPGDWNSDHAYTLQDAVSLAGNTSGALANVSSGTLILAGGNNITLSQNGNSVTISGANAAPAPVGFSAGASSDNLGAVVFSNSGGVSFGLAGSTITATVATNYQSQGAYLTTAALSQDSSKYAFTGFTTTSVAGTAVAGTHDTNGLKLAVPAYLTTAQAPGAYLTTARASNDAVGLNTAQTNVTWTVNSSGLSLNAGGYAGTGFTSTTTAGTQVKATQNTAGLSMAVPAFLTAAGASPVNFSAGAASADLGSVVFSNSNGVSFGLNGSTITASVDATSSVVGTSGISLSTAGNTVTILMTASNANGVSFGFSGGSVLTATVATNYQSQGAYLTTADLSQNSTKYAGTGFTTATTAGTNLVGTLNTAGISMGVPAWLTAAAGGNNLTVQDSATTLQITKLIFSNANNVSFGLSTAGSVATVTASASAQSNQTVGFYATGNTTNNSSTTFDARTAGTWNALGAMTLGFSNGSVQVSAPATSSIVGTNGISISTAGSTISVQNIALSAYDPYSADRPITNSTLGQSTIYIAPFEVLQPLSASRINFFLSLTHTFSGAPANSTAWLALGYGIYTKNASNAISLLTSYSLSYVSASASSSTRLSVTNYIGLSNATSHSTTQYGTQSASVTDYLGSTIAGFREIALPLNLTMNPGRYWLAFSNQSSAQGASIILAHSIVQNQFSNNIAYRPFGAISAASNASFYGASEGLGIYSAQSAAFPATIPLNSDTIRGAPVMTVPYFNISGWATSTNLL